MVLFSRRNSIFLSALSLGIIATACSDGKALNSLAMEQSRASSGNSNATTSPVAPQSNDSVATTSSTIAKNNNSASAKNEPKVSEITLKTNTIDGVETIGIGTIQEARNAGHSVNAIAAQVMSSGFAVSDEALSFLGMSKFILRQYGGSVVEGVTAMGLAAVDRARAAGVKDSEIIAYAKLQGIYFGEQALNSLGLSKFILRNYGGSVVNGVFAIGLAAVDRARAAGLKDAEIRIYAKLQEVYFGEQALASLGV